METLKDTTVWLFFALFLIYAHGIYKWFDQHYVEDKYSIESDYHQSDDSF